MSDGHLQNLITGGGNSSWIDGAPPRTFAAWLTSATAENLLPDASFLVPRLTLGGLAILRERFKQPTRLRILLPVGPVLRDAAEAPHYRLLATTPAELILDNQLTQGVDARTLHRWLGQDSIEVRTVRSETALPWMASVGESLIVGNPELTRECLDPTQTMIEAGLFAPDATSREALDAVYERLWAQGMEAKAALREALQIFYAPNSPQFIYFLSLWHLFNERLGPWRDGMGTNAPLRDSLIWKTLYQFQRDGVVAILNRLNEPKKATEQEAFRGCILADSVGLGKTYSALAVIHAFKLHGKRTLVMCPKKLRENWKGYLDNQDHPFVTGDDTDFTYDLINHTDLSCSGEIDVGRDRKRTLAQLNATHYDLIVIDESHNFRTSGGQRYKWLLDYLQTHPETKLLLLSATPVSNRMADLTNQLALVYRARKDEHGTFNDPNGTFKKEVQNIVSNAERIAKRFAKDHAKEPERLTAATLSERLPKEYFALLARTTIARSRAGIKQAYAAEAKSQLFPAHTKSCSYSPGIDTRDDKLNVEELSAQLESLTLAAYDPTVYLRAGIQWAETTNLTAAARQRSLTALMRMNALKRLESSVYSFRKTLTDALQKRTDKILAAMKRGVVPVPESTAKALLGEAGVKALKETSLEDTNTEDDEDDEELAELLKKNLGLPLATYFDETALRTALEADQAIIKDILAKVAGIDTEHDAKFQRLKNALEEKVATPLNIDQDGHPNVKALVFTAFADTAKYVAQALAEACPERTIACVTGSDNKIWEPDKKPADLSMKKILARFAPVAQGAVKPGAPIDWLIATDCLSEGQNLQDCDLIVNYDIHWNPLRLVQRAGRIDRLGSSKRIRVDFFWPFEDLDRYIGLERRVRIKNAAAATTSSDADALSDNEVQDLDYRLHQMKILKRKGNADPDGFFTGVASAHSDFTEYLSELDNWLQADKGREQQCREAPLGLCAVTPATLTEAFAGSALPVPKHGGAILLLRRSGLSEEETKVNPFRDCFLFAIDPAGHPIGTPRVLVNQEGHLLLAKQTPPTLRTLPPEPLTPEQTLVLLRAFCRDRDHVNGPLQKRFEERGTKWLTPMLEGALKILQVNRETNRAKLLLGDIPFDYHSGLTDDRAALTLLTFALILPEETT